MDIKTIQSGDSNYTSSASSISKTPVENVQMKNNVTNDEAVSHGLVNDDKDKTDLVKDANEQKQPSDGTMKQTISDLNKKMKNTECVFGIHEATNRVMIQIIDKDTKEVIKEFPPEKTLDLFAKALEIAGLLVDEKL